jgi:recombination protein RecT
MCKKTIINKTCKPIINSSSDSNLFKQSFARTSEIIAEEEAAQEIAENANSEIIDIEIDEDPAPGPEAEQPALELTGDGPGF